MTEEIRYPYYSPRSGSFADTFDLAKWSVGRMLHITRRKDRLPNILKRHQLAKYAQRYGLRSFVESGTYLGGTVAFMNRYCERIHSIEFQPHLAAAARRRFASNPRVKIYEGSGAQWMPAIVKELTEPALFWLDGHFASGTAHDGEDACPTAVELAAVLADARYEHVILIDDACEFRGDGGYPSIEVLQNLVGSRKPGALFEIKNDLIRITPAEGTAR
jgi:hypothetical protein